jgi:hypothetical protein
VVTDTAMTENSEQAMAQEQAQAVLTQLASSVALLPQEIPEGVDTPPDGAIVLPVMEQDGTQYVPVFSSEENLVAAGADPASALPVPLVQLAQGWPSDDLWLAVDPGGEGGVALPPDVVRALPTFADDAAGEPGL